MTASRSKQPETLGIEKNPSFFLQFIDEFKSGLVKYLAVGLLSLIGLG